MRMPAGCLASDLAPHDFSLFSEVKRVVFKNHYGNLDAMEANMTYKIKARRDKTGKYMLRRGKRDDLDALYFKRSTLKGELNSLRTISTNKICISFYICSLL